MKKGFDAILILAGDIPRGHAAQAFDILISAEPRPLIAAADGGASFLATRELRPDILVGDNDSLEAGLAEAMRAAGTQVVDYPQHKDFSDAEAAWRLLVEKGCKRIAIFGADGGRIDHTMGNLLLPMLHPEVQAIFFGADYRAAICYNFFTLRGHIGDTVSLMPLSSRITGITLRGFEYPLDNYTLEIGCSRTLSNALSETEGSISLKQGALLIIHYLNQQH
ncbi:MAG: thiamine diphosphokinase [Bacillota bacterium]|nr:thiamine diphosphokinase [Bacillota bacterium]